MAQLDDLQAGLDQLDADEKALIEQDAKSFADLEAAVKAGQTNPVDLQPFIDRLKTSHEKLAQALIDSAAADATTQPPTP